MTWYWYCCAWGQKDWVERTEKDRQLQRTKTGSEKDRELVSGCSCSSCDGALGVTSKRLKDWLKKLDVKSNIELLQKVALFGTAKIVRQILETWGCWVELAL